MKALITTVIVAALAGGGWYGYRLYAAGPEASAFITAPVDRGSIVATIAATGTVEPTTKVLVGSEVSGTVRRWYADFNQVVRKDEVLLELDPDRFRTSLEQRVAAVKIAEAQLVQAEVRFKDAQRERKRIQGLFERNAASENEFLVVQAAEEAAEAAVRAAQAQCDAARAEERSAAVDLSRTVILAPIDGVVISRDVDAGQTVAASLQAPTLFTIAADLRKMQVNANVAESDVGRIREGMTATFTVDAYPERKFVGTVSQVRFNPTIVDNIVTYVTLIDVENSELLLRPGMTANITFEIARVDDALRIPNAALRFSPTLPDAPTDRRRPAPGPGDRGGPRVYRLNGGRLAEVSVEIGLTDGNVTEIRGDTLREGEEIVVDRRWNAGPQASRPRVPRSL